MFGSCFLPLLFSHSVVVVLKCRQYEELLRKHSEVERQLQQEEMSRLTLQLEQIRAAQVQHRQQKLDNYSRAVVEGIIDFACRVSDWSSVHVTSSTTSTAASATTPPSSVLSRVPKPLLTQWRLEMRQQLASVSCDSDDDDSDVDTTHFAESAADVTNDEPQYESLQGQSQRLLQALYAQIDPQYDPDATISNSTTISTLDESTPEALKHALKSLSLSLHSSDDNALSNAIASDYLTGSGLEWQLEEFAHPLISMPHIFPQFIQTTSASTGSGASTAASTGATAAIALPQTSRREKGSKSAVSSPTALIQNIDSLLPSLQRAAPTSTIDLSNRLKEQLDSVASGAAWRAYCAWQDRSELLTWSGQRCLQLALLGKPFAGKLSQAQLLCDKFTLQPIHLTTSLELLYSSSALSALPAYAKLHRQCPTQADLQALDGTTLPDDVQVAAIAAAIRAAQADASEHRVSGWLLVDFPRTFAQAKLLEGELTGFEPPKKFVSAKRSTARAGTAAAAGASPRTAPPPFDAVSLFDLVLYIDVDDQECARRASALRPLSPSATPAPPVIDRDLEDDLYDDGAQDGAANLSSSAAHEALKKARLAPLERIADSSFAHKYSSLNQTLARHADDFVAVSDWFTRFSVWWFTDGGSETATELHERIRANVRRVIEKKKSVAQA